MILADKIIEERKKNGWSQEELAEKLGVSRQAVSKWESAGAAPDLQRIIQLAKLFGVSTDYLLMDEIEGESYRPEYMEENDTEPPVRRVSLEEAKEYISLKKKGAPMIANGVAMCILSPILVVILGAFSEDKVYGITESIAVGVGVPFLFVLVAIAVYMFISFGMKESHMEHLEREVFETEYGVTGLVKELRQSFEPAFARGIGIGVVLCIVGVIPVVIAGAAGAPDHICGILVGVLLLSIAAGVNLLIRVGMVKSCYDTLLQEGDYTKDAKRANSKLEPLSGAYWSLATAGYLAWSFISGRWDFTWIVWPVAGVLFAAVSGIAKAVLKSRE